MRGAVIILASALGAAAVAATPVSAAAPGASIEDVAREKLAAVTLVRSKARRYTAAIANGRLLQAYLSAATTAEAERVKTRIVSSMKAMQDRHGLTRIRILWRDGRRLAETGTPDKGPGQDRIVKDALAHDPGTISSTLYGDTLNWAAQVDHGGQGELVVSVGQDTAAYERALLHGLGSALQVIVVNDKGKVISGSDGASTPGKPAMIAGLTLEALRKNLGIGGPAGAGVVELDGHPVRIALQSADGWTVIAMDKPAATARCTGSNEAPCR